MKKIHRVRLADIAKEANVTAVTVSKVLLGTGGNTRVGEKTAKKIRRIAKRLGYHPNLAAQQLAGKPSRSVSILAPTLNLIKYCIVVENIERRLSDIGYQANIGLTHGQNKLLERHTELCSRRGVDGILCLDEEMLEDPLAVRYMLESCPNTVFMGQLEESAFSSVAVDIVGAARLATEHLISRGLRSIGIVLLNTDGLMDRQLLTGYHAALKAAEIPFDERFVYYTHADLELSDEDAMSVIDRLVRVNEVEALIGRMDDWGIMLIKQLVQRRIEVPGGMQSDQGVAVIGIGSAQRERGKRVSPGLSSVYLCYDTVGDAMVRMFLDVVKEKSPAKSPQRVLIKPELIVRGSTP